MNYFLAALKKYADFKGRTRRKEYWYFVLFYMIIYIVLLAAATVVPLLGIAALVFILAMLVPSLAVAVRRMHDVDKSGWYIFIPIYSLILACTEGTPGSNQYGEDPKSSSIEGEIDQIGNSAIR